MEQQTRNWFRYSKVIIDVGTDVLRKLVSGNAQTPFLNNWMNVVIGRVEKIKHISRVPYLWNCFTKDLKNKDKNLKKSLQPILNSLRKPNDKLNISDQVSTFEKWKNYIEKSMSSVPSHAKDTLSFWLIEIQTLIERLNFVSTCLQTLTSGFHELCETSRKDLLRKIEHHYDDFLSSLRKQSSEWYILSNHQLKEVFTNLESKREKKLKDWNQELQMYFRLLRLNINDLLASWKANIPDINNDKELNILLDGIETETNELNETKFPKSCGTWHQHLHNLFKMWLEQMDTTKKVGSFAKQCEKELEQFPSISSQQVKDFFVSEGETLKQKLHEKHYSKLCPTSASPDLNGCDTSLLFIILKQCLVCPPMHGWHEDPPESDKSLGADILRLKSCRNEIVAHIEAAKIDQRDFLRLWLHVKSVLCRLASSLGRQYETQVSKDVDGIEFCSFNSEMESEWNHILTWCKDDIFTELEIQAENHHCVHMLQLIGRVERQRSENSRNQGGNAADKIQRCGVLRASQSCKAIIQQQQQQQRQQQQQQEQLQLLQSMKVPDGEVNCKIECLEFAFSFTRKRKRTCSTTTAATRPVAVAKRSRPAATATATRS